MSEFRHTVNDITIGLALIVIGIAGLNYVAGAKARHDQAVQRAQLSHKLEVQQACDISRLADNGALEQACGDLQTKYNMEYLCNNLTPSATCWVEVK